MRAILDNQKKQISHFMSGTYGLVCSALLLSSSFAAAAQLPEKANCPELKKGYEALEASKGQEALEIFNLEARKSPDSPEAHFGRASALKLLNRHEEAAKEFKLTLLLEPSPEIKAKCSEHLHNIESARTKKPARHERPQTIRSQDVEHSINNILKQSEDKVREIQHHSESFANHIYNSKSQLHNRALERAKQEAEEMRQARIRIGRRLLPAFSEAEIRERQQELQFKAMQSMARAQSDLEARHQEAQNRATAIKETAEGLESQMINKPAETSGVFLMPEGTNLYVRNYGHFDPVMPEPPVPLQAVPLKLPQVIQMEAEAASQKRKVKAKASARQK